MNNTVIEIVNECKGCPYIDCLVKVMCSGHLKCKARLDYSNA